MAHLHNHSPPYPPPRVCKVCAAKDGHIKELRKHIKVLYQRINLLSPPLNREIKRKQDEFQAVIQSMNDGVAIFNRAKICTFSNPRCQEILGVQMDGRTLQEISGLTVTEEGIPVDRKNGVTISALRGVTTAPLVVFVTKTGRWISVKSNPIYENEQVVAAVSVITDITERRQVEKGLHNDVDKRNDFISMASHELKNPIAAMQLSTMLIKKSIEKNLISPEKVSKFVDITFGQLKKMQNLVEEMLNVSHIDSGKIEIKREYLNLTELVAEIVERYPKSNITFSHDEDVVGYRDKYRTDQVITNLITNAIKYGKGNPIDVRVTQNREFMVVEVEDHGEGISLEDQKKIFDKFSRVTNNSSISGLGLGLYIVSQIVKFQGGTITVKSNLGAGSTFCVRYPIVDQSGRHVSKFQNVV